MLCDFRSHRSINGKNISSRDVVMRWYLHIKCHWSYPGGYIKSTQTQQNTSKREPCTELMEWTVCSAQKNEDASSKISRTVEAPKFVVRVAIALNTLRPRQNGRHFPDDNFSSTFSWMKMFEFRLKFHWTMFTRVPLKINLRWFR